MVKARLVGEKGVALVLGFTPQDLAKLAGDTYYEVNGSELGIPGVVVFVCLGADDASLLKRINGLNPRPPTTSPGGSS